MIADPTKPVDCTGNRFCGPLVLAAILGTSTGTVCEKLAGMRREERGVRLSNGRVKRVRARTSAAIKATYHTELFALLERQGYTVTPVANGATRRTRKVFVNSECTRLVSGRALPMLAVPEQWHECSWLEYDYLPLWRGLLRLDTDTYIVHTPGHWAIASGGHWCETYTRGAWVPFRQAPGQRRKVLQVWRVTK